MRTKGATRTNDVPVKRSRESIEASIANLERKIAQLKAFDVDSIQDPSDPRLQPLTAMLYSTVGDALGENTSDYDRFLPTDIGYLSLHRSERHFLPTQMRVLLEKNVFNLQAIIELLRDRLMLLPEPVNRTVNELFKSIDIHPEIARPVGTLFDNGHYPEAIEAACKALERMVKLRSARDDPSGTELMQLVFSNKTPILKFGDQANRSDKSEQQGMMYLFAGAMLALRNPRAHGFKEDDSHHALDCIVFISLLAKSLERATT